MTIDVLQPTSVNKEASLWPGRTTAPGNPSIPVPVKLGGESCVVNRGRPLPEIFVDEAGYPCLVNRRLNRFVVSFAV